MKRERDDFSEQLKALKTQKDDLAHKGRKVETERNDFLMNNKLIQQQKENLEARNKALQRTNDTFKTKVAMPCFPYDLAGSKGPGTNSRIESHSSVSIICFVLFPLLNVLKLCQYV